MKKSQIKKAKPWLEFEEHPKALKIYNSFLLHGFYCYSHLIFARISDKTGIKYIIGVPGIYHNREKFMARMFGFDSFKSIKRKELRTGELGYWYTPIYFN